MEKEFEDKINKKNNKNDETTSQLNYTSNKFKIKLNKNFLDMTLDLKI